MGADEMVYMLLICQRQWNYFFSAEQRNETRMGDISQVYGYNIIFVRLFVHSSVVIPFILKFVEMMLYHHHYHIQQYDTVLKTKINNEGDKLHTEVLKFGFGPYNE